MITVAINREVKSLDRAETARTGQPCRLQIATKEGVKGGAPTVARFTTLSLSSVTGETPRGKSIR
jgi:hypothetical protein